jgi:hypothetical protein
MALGLGWLVLTQDDVLAAIFLDAQGEIDLNEIQVRISARFRESGRHHLHDFGPSQWPTAIRCLRNNPIAQL